MFAGYVVVPLEDFTRQQFVDSRIDSGYNFEAKSSILQNALDSTSAKAQFLKSPSDAGPSCVFCNTDKLSLLPLGVRRDRFSRHHHTPFYPPSGCNNVLSEMHLSAGWLNTMFSINILYQISTYVSIMNFNI